MSMTDDEIEQSYERLESSVFRAFIPSLIVVLVTIGFDAILTIMALSARMVFDDLHFIPIFLPQFFTLVIALLFGVSKWYKISGKKNEFKRLQKKYFIKREIDALTSNIDAMIDERKRLERELLDA